MCYGYGYTWTASLAQPFLSYSFENTEHRAMHASPIPRTPEPSMPLTDCLELCRIELLWEEYLSSLILGKYLSCCRILPRPFVQTQLAGHHIQPLASIYSPIRQDDRLVLHKALAMMSIRYWTSKLIEFSAADRAHGGCRAFCVGGA